MKQKKILSLVGIALLFIGFVVVSSNTANKNNILQKSLNTCEQATKGPLYAQCFIEYFKTETKNKGFKTTINDFASYTRKTNDIEGACHLISHKLGESLWKEYLANISKVDPTICSYGLIHGAFIEAAKYLSPKEFTNMLVGACDISPDPGVCVHGFGHAIAEAKVTPEQANTSCEAVNQHYKGKDFYSWIPSACSEGYQMGLADHPEYLQGKNLTTLYNSCKAFNTEMFNGCIKAAVMTYSRYQPNDLARDGKLKEMINFCKKDTFENCNTGIGRGLNEAFPPYLVTIAKQASMMDKYCSQTNQPDQCVGGLLGQRIFATNYGRKEAVTLCQDAGSLITICNKELAKIPLISPNKKSPNKVLS